MTTADDATPSSSHGAPVHADTSTGPSGHVTVVTAAIRIGVAGSRGSADRATVTSTKLHPPSTTNTTEPASGLNVASATQVPGTWPGLSSRASPPSGPVASTPTSNVAASASVSSRNAHPPVTPVGSEPTRTRSDSSSAVAHHAIAATLPSPTRSSAPVAPSPTASTSGAPAACRSDHEPASAAPHQTQETIAPPDRDAPEVAPRVQG